MVDRAHALSLRFLLPAIVCLEVLWLRWFHVVALPNYRKDGVTRGYLLWRALPEVVPGVKPRDSFLGQGIANLSHVENIAQRLPIVLAAALIAAAAIAVGHAIIERVDLSRRLKWPVRIALAYGLGTAVLGVLTLMAGRLGWLDPWLIRSALAGLAVLAFLHGAARRRPTERASDAGPPAGDPAARTHDGLPWLFGPLIALFVTITLLGSMLPATDFDVLEYHLQGPKEYFQAGRIAFLPHNVYTNMPFDVEMLHLLGMSVTGDWWWGALVGQLLVALFVPAGAVLIHATAATASTRSGWFAALVYVSTPWVYRFGVIAYVEGPLCYYHAALVWAWVAGRSDRADRPARHWLLLGLLAGGAMGCKYTALISAVVPFGALAVAGCWRHRGLRPLLSYALGWAIVMAPWMMKNVIDTGDPVYPLGYRAFHGRHWDDAMEARWRAAHGPHPVSWKELGNSVVDVAGRSDWQSPLYAALAPLALLRPGTRRLAMGLWGYAGYLFFTWWLLTHRLDRFWLPMLPVLAVLAGLGADWVRHRAWTLLLSGIITVTLLTCFAYDSSALAGLNEWTGDLVHLRRDIPRRLNHPLYTLDEKLPPDARILLVGQAAVFHVTHSILYNTVFNPETIETLAKGRDSSAFRQALRERRLTHVYVDWHEIRRHREPGGYGFTDFVTPELFARWVADGVLERPLLVGQEQELYRVR